MVLQRDSERASCFLPFPILVNSLVAFPFLINVIVKVTKSYIEGPHDVEVVSMFPESEKLCKSKS